MAQFKIGEYVTSKERPYLGKGKIIDEVDYNQYIVRFDDGDESLFEGSDLVAANACAKNGIRSTNAAVNAALNACARNARYSASTPLKSIDYQLEDLYGSHAKLGDLVQEYKAKRYVEYVDRAADTAARDKVYDALEALTGIKCKWSVNSANSCAKNACGTAMNGVFEKADEAKLKELGKRLFRAYEAWATKDEMWENAEREWATFVRICKEARRYGNLFLNPNSGGFIVRPVPRLPHSSLWTEDLKQPPKYRQIEIPYGPNKGKMGWTCSTNACAKNACAKNADKLSKRFGDVEVLAFEDGRLGIRYVITLGGFDEFVNAVSWDDAGKKCAAEARQMASLFEKRAASIKQAAAWLEANAK